MTPSSTKYMASCGDNFPIVRIACFFIGGVLFASACTCSIGNILLWSVWLVLLISYISIVLFLPPSQFYKWRSYVGILGLSAIFWAGLLCRMQYGSNVNDSLSNVWLQRNQQQQAGAIVYPNPSNQNFTMKLIGNETAEVKVFSSTGILIAKYSNLPPHLALQMGSNWSKGLYFAVIKQGKTTTVKKMIKR